jgi:hypothetical protein
MNPTKWSLFVDHLSVELRAFLDAPMIFFGAFVAIAAATWAVMRWVYLERLVSKDERISAHAEKIWRLERELDESREQVLALRARVADLTPRPVHFPLADFTTPKELAEFVEGVRNRAGDIAVHAKEWDKGFPGLQEVLCHTESIEEGRKSGEAAAKLVEHFSPEEDMAVRQFALASCENLHRTATELLRFLTTGRKQ